MTESLSLAERKVCKRFRMPPRSFRKRFRRIPSVIGVFKAAAFAAIWVVPRRCLRPNVILWQGWRLFLFSDALHPKIFITFGGSKPPPYGKRIPSIMRDAKFVT